MHVSIRDYRARRMLVALAMLASIVTLDPIGAAAADQAKVPIKDFMYQTTSLTVKSGTTVTWANNDDEPHTIISDTGVFRSSALDTNETFSYKFDKPGVYPYHCSIHPRMVATIVVE
jgi:plastocyanin